MTLTVDGPLEGEYRWRLEVLPERPNQHWEAELKNWLRGHIGEAVQLWVRQVDEASDKVVCQFGFEPYRDLWQLRRGLPAPKSGLPTRAATKEDAESIVALNGRAFAWHPEQGSLSVEKFLKTMTEDGFSYDGLRLCDDPHAALMGFCWTKIHHDQEPEVGEIYVIAVDPSFQGRGLGKPLTFAGLEWLSEAGLGVAMLYVESDNDPANAIYQAIGFTHHRTDRAYSLWTKTNA